MLLAQFSNSAILLTSIAAAAALVYAPFMVVGFARMSTGYDMNAPRAMFDGLPDWGKRATWAHQNSWESFLLYAAAALMAFVSGTSADSVRWAVLAYLVARLLFSVFYIANIAPLRSLMFAVGSVSIFTLMSESIRTVLAAG
ncbi:MAPEG family protein [filamentous cyanobacterium LEGE 11480]|uniref:MAPEG family protein n=1 Tax=Romeriopsis navalis LEGE 11480 TaxID=2777977 RepID=A0A928Z1U9_9CYAN|nr:MAPEG family protein [Romeriopsis navalis]MBE9028864.1 MAPEG family protein [Romeriopsis navalis LEGE 11480]